MFGRKIRAKLSVDNFLAVIVISDACKFGLKCWALSSQKAVITYSRSQ